MSRVSRSKLTDSTTREITEHFLSLIASLNNQREIENFFEDFLTKEEKTMLAKRLVLFMMLQKGYSPPTIQGALQISYETVRSYSIQLTTKNDLFQQTINKLLARKKTQDFWNKIEASLKPLGLFMKARSDMRARAKFLSGD